ncbi:MAG TPA: DUF2249 domain-containing protein [Streptosporangiaceae bacterium]|nr:DUF2249 domain-containing protein [Streptosporangiaceae bacterium]
MATFDARPVIAAGDEPFDDIMAAADGLAAGEDLIVLAPFEPVPLESVLASRGFSCEVTEIAEDDWQVTFTRATAAGQ